MADQPLSPAAQAVQDAMCSRWPRSHEWIAAAALRAAADQVVPEVKSPGGFREGERQCVRREILAIAAELEATTP